MAYLVFEMKSNLIVVPRLRKRLGEQVCCLFSRSTRTRKSSQVFVFTGMDIRPSWPYPPRPSTTPRHQSSKCILAFHLVFIRLYDWLSGVRPLGRESQHDVFTGTVSVWCGCIHGCRALVPELLVYVVDAGTNGNLLWRTGLW